MFLWYFAALSRFIMPKTPRAVSSVPSTISTPLVSEILASVSAPVSSLAPQLRFHFLVFSLRGLPLESLLRKGSLCVKFELFEIFSRFLVWEKTPHPPSSGVSPFSAESARPVYTLAPSVLPSSVNPPTPGWDCLGLAKKTKKTFLVPGDQRLTSCHFGAGVPRQLTALLRCAERPETERQRRQVCLSLGAIWWEKVAIDDPYSSRIPT